MAINAPTFPGQYIPGTMQPVQPVVMVTPTAQNPQGNVYQQQMLQQNLMTGQYADPNVVVVVTQASVLQQSVQFPAATQPVVIPQTAAVAIPVTSPQVQGVGAPAQLSVTYVHAAPPNYQTMPMPDPQWLNRTSQQQQQQQIMMQNQPGQQRFSLNRQLTSQQRMHLVTAQPQARRRPINSLPELEVTRSQNIVTQSARYLQCTLIKWTTQYLIFFAHSIKESF